MGTSKDTKVFSDDEYRILLCALGRESKVCSKIDSEYSIESADVKPLVPLVESITRKIKKLQYAVHKTYQVDGYDKQYIVRATSEVEAVNIVFEAYFKGDKYDIVNLHATEL